MATYYIAPSGNDTTGSGAIGSPWLTIEKFLTVATAGDTLYCRGGTYSEVDIVWDAGANGTAGNPITIAAYPGETPVFDGGGGQSVFIVITARDYVIIDGLTIRNHNGGGSAIWIGYSGSGTDYSVGHIIRNCHIYNIGSSSLHHGIYVSYGNVDTKIYNNIIHDCSGYGLHCYTSSSGLGPNNAEIYNNVVYNCVYGALVIREATNCKFYNNTLLVMATGDAADFDATSASTATFRNNILGSQIRYGKPATASHNLFIGVAPDDSGTGSINGDPAFVDAAGGNHHLLSTSDAIDAGTTVALVTTDRDGMPRPQGAAYDIGAYEYGTQQSIAPDTIAASTNLSGAVTAIDEDPDSPDANWLTASSATSATDVRVTFPTPTGAPVGTQDFRLWLRKTTGLPSPNVTVELRQNNTLRRTLLSGTSIASTSGQIVRADWLGSDLLSTLDGSDVECRISAATGNAAGALPAYSAAGTLFDNATMPQTNLALNSPAHAVGDLLVAVVLCRNTNNNGLLQYANGTAGTTGWKLENNNGEMFGGAQNARIAFAWKVATSTSEVCAITTTGGTSTDRIKARVYKFTAANGFASPAVQVISSAQSGSGTTMTMPTVAAGGGNERAVAIYGISVSSTVAAASGESGGDWTEPVAEDAGTNGTIGIQVSDQSGGGGISGGTSTITSGAWVTVGFRIVPAASGAATNTVEIGAVEWNAQYAAPTNVDETANIGSQAVAITGRQPAAASGSTATIGSQSISVTGGQPAASSGAVAPIGGQAVAATGIQTAVSSGTTAPIGSQSVAVAGLQPVAGVLYDAAIGTQSVVAAERQIGVSSGAAPLIGAQAVAASGNAVTPSSTAETTIGRQEVAVSGAQATAAASSTAAIGSQAVAVTGYVTNIYVVANWSIAIGLGSASVSGMQPAASSGVAAPIGGRAVAATGIPPEPTLASTSQAIAQDIAHVAYAPSIGAETSANIGAASIVLTGLGPSVAADSAVKSLAQQVDSAGLPPSASAATSATASINAGALIVAGRQPAASSGASSSVAGAAVVSVLGNAPSIALSAIEVFSPQDMTHAGHSLGASSDTNSIITIGFAQVAVLGGAPSIALSSLAASTAPDLIISAHAITATAGATVTANIGAGAFSAVGSAPVVSSGATSLVFGTSRSLTGNAVSAFQAASFCAGALDLVYVGRAPSSSLGINSLSLIGRQQIVVTGRAPVVGVGGMTVSAIGAESVSISLYAPTVTHRRRTKNWPAAAFNIKPTQHKSTRIIRV